MPEICRFLGILITMYFDEHNPPHFHARYNVHPPSLYGIGIPLCSVYT